MDAASLINLAAARGVNLQHVAGVASDTKGIARKRERTRTEIRLGIDVHESVTGRESRTYRRPLFSIAELGQAAQGLGEVPWRAALFSYAGAQEHFWFLWSALAFEAQRLARREHWPARVASENGEFLFFRERLAMLTLDRDKHQHLFAAAPALMAIYMGVSVQTWERQLFDPYRSLESIYQQWLGMARGMIARWINEGDRGAALDRGQRCG